MCGIAGVLRRDARQPASAERVTAMCDAIVHRGPDDSGIFVDGPVGLGMRRLSIIDLAGGHQPMRTSDGRFTIVFNGEIYNHREVRRDLESRGRRFHTTSDTEVILQAYEEYGPSCLERLNGMFAIAIWDARERSLFLARDRVGIKPLYVFDGPAGLAFGSEIKSLLASNDVPDHLDDEALHYFLRYGYVPSSTSLLRGVRQLLPGHYMVATPGRTGNAKPFWTLEYVEDSSRRDEEWPELVYGTLRAAVERQLISDVPLGAFLSGGLDSSSLVSMMAEITGAPVSTYSIGFAGEDAFHSELADARAIATRFGTRHHEIVVEPNVADLMPRLVHHLDQPLADSSFLVTYLVSTLAARSVKVIISGVGGDEIFGGYRRYLGPRYGRAYGRVPAQVRRMVARGASRLPVDRGSRLRNLARLGRGFVTGFDLPAYERYDHAVQMLPEPEVVRLAPGLPDSERLLSERREPFESASDRDPITPLMHLDLKTSLVDSLLLLTDKMTMATSLEARVPFLDHELIELAARIPPRLKVKGTALRYIQKEAMRGHLPEEVFRRRKRGFGCPVGRWFRRELRDLVHDTLSESALRTSGVFEPAAVAGIIDAHDRFREDRTETLLALLTFQMWRGQLRERSTNVRRAIGASAAV